MYFIDVVVMLLQPTLYIFFAALSLAQFQVRMKPPWRKQAHPRGPSVSVQMRPQDWVSSGRPCSQPRPLSTNMPPFPLPLVSSAQILYSYALHYLSLASEKFGVAGGVYFQTVHAHLERVLGSPGAMKFNFTHVLLASVLIAALVSVEKLRIIIDRSISMNKTKTN